MNRFIQISLISAACAGSYIVLRSLPVEKCEFLHYGEFVNAEGVIEGCGYEETEFFDMSEIRYPVIVEFTPLSDPVIGQPLTCSLTLFTTTGKPVEWEQIAVSHTERLHALVVDRSLQDYQHVHPQPAGPPGHYLVEVIPQRPGPYSVYLDFIPLTTNRRTLLETGFDVAGVPLPPTPDTRLEYREPGMQYKFVPAESRLVTDRELTFTLVVVPDDSTTTTFTPVMDSYAHVVAFDEKGTGFAHLHPVNSLVKGQDPQNPDLRFTFMFDKPGYYRVWTQFIVNGRHTFVPFDLIVAAA